MKVLVIQFDDTAQLAAFTKGLDVTVTNPSEETVNGSIAMVIDSIDPFEGAYTLTPYTPE